MNAVRKHLSLINKNAFQKSMIKLTWGEDMQLAKEKHFQMIVNTLLGQNDKISQDEGVKVIVEYLQQVDLKKWMKSLKTLMLVHYILNTIPKKLQPLISQFIDGPQTQGNESAPLKGDNIESSLQANQAKRLNAGILESNGSKRGGSIPRTSNRYMNGNNKQTVNQNSNQLSQIDIVHQILVQKYYDYVIIFNEKLDTVNYLAGKEISNWPSFAKEWQKIKTVLVLFTHVQTFMRELEVSLTYFKKVAAVQRIACLLSNNLMQSYTILKHIVQSIQTQYRNFDSSSDFIRFFNFYSEFITITKNMSKFNLLQQQICQQFLNDFTTLQLYVINKDLNREIELFHLNVRSTRKQINIRYGGGNDCMSMGVSTHAEDSPVKFTKEIITRSDIFFQQNKQDVNKKCQGDDQDSVFSDPAYKYAKIDRPQSANPLSNKHTIESCLEGRFAKDAKQQNKKLILDSENNTGRDSKDQEEADQNAFLQEKKDSSSSTIKAKEESEKDNGQTSIKVINNESILRKNSNPSQGYNQINSSFKVPSKQFYDVKNNPLSFLKSTSLSQEPNQQLIGKEPEANQELGNKSLNKKSHSLNENEDLQHIKHNGENDLTQDMINSKNATSECSPPQNGQNKFSSNPYEGSSDQQKDSTLIKKKMPVKASHQLNKFTNMDLKTNSSDKQDNYLKNYE